MNQDWFNFYGGDGSTARVLRIYNHQVPYAMVHVRRPWTNVVGMKRMRLKDVEIVKELVTLDLED